MKKWMSVVVLFMLWVATGTCMCPVRGDHYWDGFSGLDNRS